MTFRTSSSTREVLLGALIEEGEAFFEVEGGGYTFECEAQLYHLEGDFWLDTDDDRFRPAETGHVGNVAQRADCERVHHVEHGHVYDDALGAELPDPLRDRLAQLVQICVC